MFGKIKFQILLPYNEDAVKKNATNLKLMGVKIKSIEETDILDNSNNKIREATILVCAASKEVFEKVKKIYEIVSYRKGMPILC